MLNDMSWNRQQSLAVAGFVGFAKVVNNFLNDSGAMSIKVTFFSLNSKC